MTGALQDLDRAVVIGQRSYGKGLVQSPRPLGYNAMLKLTTAKYYIPSGRCIQAIDYSHSQEGSVKAIPDSLIKMCIRDRSELLPGAPGPLRETAGHTLRTASRSLFRPESASVSVYRRNLRILAVWIHADSNYARPPSEFSP